MAQKTGIRRSNDVFLWGRADLHHGMHRLPNGNTMICEGECGRLIEVTPDQQIVWEWISPFVHDFKGRPNIQIFKTRTYAPDSPELSGRDLSGASCAEINHQYGLPA